MIKKKGTFHKRRVPLFCIWVMLYLDCKIYLPMYFLPFMMYIWPFNGLAIRRPCKSYIVEFLLLTSVLISYIPFSTSGRTT